MSTLLWLTGNRLVDTGILSNLGKVEDPPQFAGAGPTVEMWFSAPGRMPCGLSVGAVTVNGRIHLSFRFRWPLLGQDAARHFAELYVDELEMIVKEAS